MSHPIKLPNLTLISDTDQVSGFVDIQNNNMSELSGYASVECAGLIQLAEFGDTLVSGADCLKAITPCVLNDRLSGTFNVLPAIDDYYSIGTTDLYYSNIYGTTINTDLVNLSGLPLTVSGGELYFDGQPVASDPISAETHLLEDPSIHINVANIPISNGMTFIRNGSNWTFGYPGNIDPTSIPLNGDALVFNSGAGLFQSSSNTFIKRDGSINFQNNQSMDNNKITDLNPNLNAYNAFDAIPKAYVDNIAAIPPGSIMMSFTSIMPGYLDCNGDSYPISAYPDLFSVIGYRFGDAGTPSGDFFNVPDTRGLFFRSMDNGAGVDPDAATRTDRGDGTTGDAVGTKQDDEFESHSHTLGTYSAYDDAGTSTEGPNGINDADISNVTDVTGGSETRPKNINVRTFIKY